MGVGSTCYVCGINDSIILINADNNGVKNVKC